MQVEVRGRNIEVTEPLRQYAQRKLGRLRRYLARRPLRAQVVMWVDRGRHGIEVTMPLPVNGLLLRAEEESADMYASIDLVVEKLERQLLKLKTRLQRKARRSGPRRGVEAEGFRPQEAGPEEEEGRVVRVKRFALKPMDVDEAILQMELLGHDFFVFRNRESGEVNVVYRRRDGQYGLIEPEE